MDCESDSGEHCAVIHGLTAGDMMTSGVGTNVAPGNLGEMIRATGLWGAEIRFCRRVCRQNKSEGADKSGALHVVMLSKSPAVAIAWKRRPNGLS